MMEDCLAEQWQVLSMHSVMSRPRWGAFVTPHPGFKRVPDTPAVLTRGLTLSVCAVSLR